MKKNNSTRAPALQITFSIALILGFAILLTSAAATNPKQTFRQSPLGGPTLGNYPDTSLPLSTDTTVTPDAMPSNTTSINVSTSTDFEGTLTGDPMTGVVRVTDAHPAGSYTVTITAFDKGGATATKTFKLTVTTPAACSAIDFGLTEFYAGGRPYSVAVGDFNGDGRQDLAVANSQTNPPGVNAISILLGDGAGNFGAPTNFNAGDSPHSIAVGDFNGDGKQDLVVANFSSTVSILLGDGIGNFGAPTNFAANSSPFSVRVGDFNGDGKQDLALANLASSMVSILLGDGTGNFSAPTNFAVVANSRSLVLGDFNSDGKQDLAVANFSSTVSILLGDGTGHFSAPTNFAVGTRPVSIAVGDFDGDGKQDLVTANFASDNVSILLGDGTGHFSARTNFDVASDPASVAVGDFNGDGKQDLAVTNVPFGPVSILLGDGTGHFDAPQGYSVIGGPQSVAVGDFNGDGKQDLATANELLANVTIFLNNCRPPVSRITPAGTTCSQFSSGTAETLGSVLYQPHRNNGLIYRVAPRNFLYWLAVTAPAGNNIVTVTQTITTGNFNTFFAAIGNGSNVFDSDCVPLPRSIRQSGDTVTVRFNAQVAGTYFIGINYNSQNLIGEPVPNPQPTVHYEFTTGGVSDSTSGLDLVKHQLRTNPR